MVWVLLLGWLVIAIATGCRPEEPPVPSTPRERVRGELHLDHAQPRLPVLDLWVGDQVLKTEIARRPVEIATGMMFRQEMGEQEAMLFVFARPEPRAFYMRNTVVPLSVAYLDPEGVILEIHDLQPLDETSVESASPRVQYALEVPQGWFQRHRIGVGALVRTSQGGLHEMNWATLRPAAMPVR